MSDVVNKLEFPITAHYSPEVTIEVVGIQHNTKVVAVVDTGFTGFLQIPLSVGIACNLRLWGTGYSILADGRRVQNLQCVGEVIFGDKRLFNIIQLSETSDDCLLGMRFLNEIGMDFTVMTSGKKAIFTAHPQKEEQDAPAAKANPEEPSKKNKK